MQFFAISVCFLVLTVVIFSSHFRKQTYACFFAISQLLPFVTRIDHPNGGHVFTPEKVTNKTPKEVTNGRCCSIYVSFFFGGNYRSLGHDDRSNLDPGPVRAQVALRIMTEDYVLRASESEGS